MILELTPDLKLYIEECITNYIVFELHCEINICSNKSPIFLYFEFKSQSFEEYVKPYKQRRIESLG